MDHPTDRPKRVKKEDRTGTWISFGLHVGVIVISLIILANTKMGQDLIKNVLGATRDQKKPEDRPKPPPAPPRTGQRRAPVDAPPPSGARKAADAPPPVGEGFITETKEKKTSGTSGGDGKTNVAVKVAGPVVKVAPPKLFASAPAKSDIKQLYVERSKEAASTEAFGSEQISKSGVSDAGAIIKNVSGATIIDGKFAVIRGLSDRYVTTTLNGGEIPSPDPYRRSAPLDLFPAQIINKVVVTKTFTPDQPGSYTGGGINIVTKSFPENAFANFGIGGSYNPQANLDEKFLTYDGGKFDWAGMDDGGRELPSSLANPNVVVPSPPFSAPRPGTPANDLLRQQRFAQAETLQDLTRQMGAPKFAPYQASQPLNHNFALSAGDTTHLLGLPLGVFGSFAYRHDFASYDDGLVGRYSTDVGSGTPQTEKTSVDARSTETVNWSGMVNLAYQLHPSHELGFTFLYNQNSEKLAQVQAGTIDDDPGATFHQNRLLWTERNLQTYQLKGAHQFPEAGDVKVDWLAALAHTTQSEPDNRFFNYRQEGGGYVVGHSSNPDPKQPTRYFRELDEKNHNEKFDITVPFRNWNLDDGLAKVGFFNSFSERTFTDRGISYGGDDAFNGNPNDYLTPSNLGYTPTTNASGSVNFNWHRYILNPLDSTYNAESGIRAGYFMLDTPVTETLRFVGGVRYEITDLQVHSESDIASFHTGLTTNDSKIAQADLLPAAGLIWSMRNDMNLRVHFSQTIARPSFRELAAYRSYDPILDDLLDGNPNLEMSAINNYDVRWEWFPQPGEIVSLSLFYKSLENAIEREFEDVQGSAITFDNRKEGTVFGVEFEARKNLGFIDPLFTVFSVGGNVSLISSETELTDAEYFVKQQYLPGSSRTRQLYDQSPYIINLDLSFDNPYSGTSASIIYNVAGPRITIASLNTEDVFEQPAPGLDLIIGQKIGRHLTVKFAVKNLLNPTFERTYGEKSDLIYSSYKKGRSFGLSMSYDF